jgi:hypothetical protein
VSRLLDPVEFEQYRRLWMSTYSPISVKELEAWRKDWQTGLAAMRYVHVQKVAVDGPQTAMIGVRCSIHSAAVQWEGVQADLVRIWNDNLSEKLDAIHSVVTGTGLTMSFVGLNTSKCYVTGRVSVERQP